MRLQKVGGGGGGWSFITFSRVEKQGRLFLLIGGILREKEGRSMALQLSSQPGCREESKALFLLVKNGQVGLPHWVWREGKMRNSNWERSRIRFKGEG